jgi:hypothetical protein
MFAGLDPSLFDRADFKEDSVREFVIAPMLKRLGYAPSGELRMALSKKLKHPFVRAGTQNVPVMLVPDYTLYCGDKAILVLEAKSPSEDVLAPKHVQQTYSYASHPEINCREFALCNGRRLVVFSVDSPEPLVDLHFEEFEAKWDSVEKYLSARFLTRPYLRRFRPDFGTRLKRLGFTRDNEIVFVAVRLNLFAKVNDKLFMAAADCDPDGTGIRYCASFDFRKGLLADIVSGLPPELRQQLCSEVVPKS